MSEEVCGEMGFFLRAKDRKRLVRTSIYGTIIVLLALPSVLITLYTYPCQDDFHYAFFAKETMAEGYNLLHMAIYWMIRYYKTFSGCYTSSFLGFFVSGLINCSIWGIRIFEFFSALCFYFTLYVFVYAFAFKAMGFMREKVLPLYCLVLALYNCVIYYVWQEAFYWFITSVQYLLILSFIVLGTSLFILALYEEKGKRKTVLFILASVLGFLGSGGTLSIAAFCCSIYLLAAVWGIVEKEQLRASCGVMAVTLFGAILNGLAPGNYIRAGEKKTIADILYAGKMAIRYMIERWETFLKNPIFWIIMILLCMVVCSARREPGQYRFRLPGVFILALFGFVSGIIFPTTLGYSYETYKVLMRGNFISDTAFYLYIFFGIFYLRGWLDRKYEGVCEKLVNRDTVCIAAFLIAALLVHDRNGMKQIPFIREYQELLSGKYTEYSDFCVDIYRQIEMSESEVAEVHTEFVEDITCLINPQLYEGWYDPEVEYANQSIARYYGKKAAYIFYD